ncbi:hypothetical protein SMD22_01435 (plasmid) [Brevibacillus halotolerans]|nr:hypothetical protein SMD22_01435 [Brevibacillus halotolerans]
MDTVLKGRLEELYDAIKVLAEIFEKQRQIKKEKAVIARSVNGLPYYWGEFSGTIHPSTRETDVEARLIHQVTGEEVHWILDAYRVNEHLLKIKEFSSWKEYDKASKLSFAVSTEQMLVKCGRSEIEVAEKMTEYCSKFKIPYKTYFQEAF